MTSLYAQMCNMFIKPARQTYSDFDLGSISLGKHGIRQNFVFESHKGYQIKASFFRNKNNNSQTCIIYLHSFNGSRLQSLRYASQIVEKGYHFCSFDFAGCGNSGGQYVSLGCNQKYDVLKLIQSLKNKYGITEYFIWGRSMGAVTAIKFYQLLTERQNAGQYTDILILGLVLDSAFISLKRMVIQVGKNRLSIPQFIIKAALIMIKSSIEEKGGFKFQDLQLDKEIESIRCCTLLIASKQDTFVQYTHSQQIFTKLKLHDNKQIEYTRGEHYESRDQKTINSIYSFFDKKHKRYNNFITKMGCLRQSRVNGISRVKQFSLEKHTKSLRKYEPKTQKKFSAIKQRKNHMSNKYILHEPDEEQQQENKFIQSIQIHAIGSEKKISQQQSCELNKQYETEKKIGQPKIQFVISPCKEIKYKNESQKLIKTNLVFQIEQQLRIQQSIHQQTTKGTERTLQLLQTQQNHCNIISDKLRKKGKHQKQKYIQVINIKQIPNSNIPKGQSENPHAKIRFIMGNNTTNNSILYQNKKAKPSMTAQQYKNSQIKMNKGVIVLSPKIKNKDKTSCTDLKLKISQEIKNMEPSKSSNNLITLGHRRANTNSFKKLNLLIKMQGDHEKTK